MTKKKFMLLASLMLVLSIFLAACSDGKEDAGGSKDDGGKDKGKDTTEEGGKDSGAELDFPLEVSNDGEAMEDGEMTIAMVADEPF